MTGGAAGTASASKVAAAVLVATEIPNLYSGLLPSMFTISSPFFHQQSAKEGNTKRIRQGEVIATGMSIAIIEASARLFETNLVRIMGYGMVALLVGCYEYALSHPAEEEATSGVG